MRLARIAIIPLILILLISAVACKSNSYQPTPYIPPTSTPISTHVSTPVPTPTSSTQSIPLSVSIDYFWVGCAYGGDVQLVVVVGDEQGGGDSPSYLIPPGDTDYDMGNFALKNTGHQRVFHTASVEGALKIDVLAYHRDNSQTEYLNALNMMEWYYGSDTINMLRSLVENMPAYDKLIGSYTYTWYPDENWGIGQHSNTEADGLRIWYSVWSDTDPGSIPQPSIENPDVTIETVTVPSTIHVTYWKFAHTLRIRNSEECVMSIAWQAHSSVTGNFEVSGDFASGIADVPANGVKDVYNEYSYYNVPYGPVDLTYTIYNGAVLLDTKSVSTVVQ